MIDDRALWVGVLFFDYDWAWIQKKITIFCASLLIKINSFAQLFRPHNYNWNFSNFTKYHRLFPDDKKKSL